MVKTKNAIAPFAAPAKALQATKNAIQNFAQNNPRQSGDGFPYLRLLGADGWMYGPEDNEVEEGSQWAANIFTATHGYVCWTDYDKESGKKNEKIGEVSYGLNEDAPPVSALPDHKPWDWKPTISVDLTCISGADKGTTVQYNASSYGGIQMLKALFADVGKQFDEDVEHPVPVITLSSSHYQHKQYGRTYKPEYEITSWAAAATAETVEAKAKPARKPAAGRKRRAA